MGTARKEANEIGGSAHCVELNISDPTSARRWMVDTAKAGDQMTWEEQRSVVVTHDPSQIKADAQEALIAALGTNDASALSAACDLVNSYALESVMHYDE